MNDASDALFVVKLPAGTKVVPFGQIQELIGIAVTEARMGGFNQATATEDEWIAVYAAGLDYATSIKEAIDFGKISVINSFTMRRLEFAVGDMLEKSLISVPELRKLIESFGGAVEVAPSLSVVRPIAPLSAPTKAVAKPVPTVGDSRLDSTVRHRWTQPDWEQWKRIDITPLWKAACLVAGFEPPMMGKQEIWAEYQLESFPSSFQQVWEAVNGDWELSRLEMLPYSGRMLWRVHLTGFVKWAIDKGFSVPADLHGIAARFPSGESLIPYPPEAAPSPKAADSLPPVTAEMPVPSPEKIWKEEARLEATKICLKAQKDGYHLGKEEIARKVVDELTRRGIQGPNGPLTPGNVRREALAPADWRRPQLHGERAGKIGETGKSGRD